MDLLLYECPSSPTKDGILLGTPTIVRFDELCHGSKREKKPFQEKYRQLQLLRLSYYRHSGRFKQLEGVK
jgi:hypothetical protein